MLWCRHCVILATQVGESLPVMEEKVLYCQVLFLSEIPCILGKVGNKPVAKIFCQPNHRSNTGLRRSSVMSFPCLTSQVGLELKLQIARRM